MAQDRVKTKGVIDTFNAAAKTYDAHATMQKVAAHILAARVIAAWKEAGREVVNPIRILDIGCGTGFVTQMMAHVFPHATLFALDAAPEMLAETKRKIPSVTPLLHDAEQMPQNEKYDLVISNMCLQWMKDPLQTLAHWRGLLAPDGLLYVTLPVAGTFTEWEQLCQDAAVPCGLQILPTATFADGMGYTRYCETRRQSFESGMAFSRHFIKTGTSVPKEGHKLTAEQRRTLLEAANAARPFTATWNILYLTARPADAKPS